MVFQFLNDSQSVLPAVEQNCGTAGFFPFGDILFVIINQNKIFAVTEVQFFCTKDCIHFYFW